MLATDAYLVVYSVCSRPSFALAYSLLAALDSQAAPAADSSRAGTSSGPGTAGPPVLALVGNKTDLVRSRQVDVRGTVKIKSVLRLRFINLQTPRAIHL